MANIHPVCKDCRYDCFANNGGKCTILNSTRNGCSMYKHAAQALEEKEAIHNYFQSGRRNDIGEELCSIRRRYAQNKVRLSSIYGTMSGDTNDR